MAKPNYQYEKRQRELEKKKKKAEKAHKKESHSEFAPPQESIADEPPTPQVAEQPTAG